MKNIFNMLSLSTDPNEIENTNKISYELNYNSIFKFLTFNKYSGKIIKISNTFKKTEKDFFCKKFVVKEDTKDLLKQYIIVYNFKKNNYYLDSIKTSFVNNVDNVLGELTFTYTKTLKNRKKKFDVRILQFLDNNYLLIQANNNLVSRYVKHKSSINLLDLFFSNVNDKDLLYKKITLNLNDLSKSDLLFDISDIRKICNPLDLVIYCKKISNNYSTIIIDSYQEVERQKDQTYNIQNVIFTNEKSKNYDIILQANKNNNVLICKTGKSFSNIEMIDRYITLYIMEPELDFFIEKIILDTSILIKNNNIKYKIKNKIDLKKHVILHNYNYLKVNYENPCD